MLAYYFQLALLAFRRGPVLTLLMVLIMGVGVAACTTTYAVFRAVSGDPLPGRSSHLFVPQIDNLGPQHGATGNHLPEALTYTDAMALIHAQRAKRQTAIYPVLDNVVPQDGVHRPFAANGYAAYADFFGMFGVPFQYGSGWSAREDSAGAQVIVISRAVNRQLFGGGNSVGRTLDLNGHDYRIVGVVDGWNPQPRFYDVNNGTGFADEPDFYLPFTRALAWHMDTNGNNSCAGSSPPAPGWDGWLRSECVWVSLWVELTDSAAVQRYRQFLAGYAAQQQHSGRFQWAANVRLFGMPDWLDHEGVVPPETRVSLLLSIGFLLVCVANTAGLLLARIMRRAGEIGVRRALGASRGEIYRQFVAEATMVGIAGGGLGVGLTVMGLSGADWLFDPQIARLAHLDLRLIGAAVLSAMLATVLAGAYPAWRAAHVQPSWQLKSQ